MKKFLIAGMALAMLAIPAAASADVQRCEASVPPSTVIKTATFTVIQPRTRVQPVEPPLDARLHGHDQPGDNTFAGVGEVTGDDSPATFDAQVPHDGIDETITGSFVNGKVVAHGDPRRWRRLQPDRRSDWTARYDHRRHD